MNDELDPIFRTRLDRLARAVPVRPEGAARRVVAASPRWRAGLSEPGMFAGTALLLILVVSAVVGSTAFLAGGGASSSVVGVSTDDAFSLSIEASNDRFQAGEPIAVEATVEYIGPLTAIEVAGSPGLPGFGVEQLDGANHAEPGYGLSCVTYAFNRGRPVSFPFVKSGGYSEADPNAAFMKAYLNISGDLPDPALRLPAGTWRIYADLSVGEGGCGGTLRHELRASITVVVEPGQRPDATLAAPTPDSQPTPTGETAAPSTGPALPSPGTAGSPVLVSATDSDATFTITVSVPQGVATTTTAITPVAELQYIGPEGSVTIYHGAPAIYWRILEIDGQRGMGWAVDTICDSTTLVSGTSLTAPFRKGGEISDDPTTFFDRAWFQDPTLRLPAGQWAISAVFDAALGGCGGEHHELTATVEIEVTP